MLGAYEKWSSNVLLFWITQDEHSCSWSFKYYMLYLHVLSDSSIPSFLQRKVCTQKCTNEATLEHSETWSSSKSGLGKALKGSSFAPAHSHICVLVEQQILPKSKNQWQLEGSVGSIAERPPHQVLPVLRPRLIKGQVERPWQDLPIQLPTLPATCVCRE